MVSRAVLYVRVSSERQVDNTSLAEQERFCRAWCERNNVAVDSVFTERGESAKTANRTQFQALFAYLSQQPKGRITHFVCYAFTRFSRSVDEGAVSRLALRKMGVALVSATEQTDDTPAGKFLSSIMLAVGELDNDQRSEKTLSGMRSRLAAGRWQWPAPTGFIPGTPKGASLIHDPAQAPLVRWLFELVAEGNTKAEALKKATALGLRSTRGNVLTQESVNRILCNAMYTGTITSKSWNVSLQGDFEPIISPELFDRGQLILSGKSPVAVPHARDNDSFPLRGFLLCAECQKPVTASLSTGKSGTRFGYYRCHRAKGHLNVRSTVVESAFLALLNRLAPRPERVELLRQVFLSIWNEKRSTG